MQVRGKLAGEYLSVGSSARRYFYTAEAGEGKARVSDGDNLARWDNIEEKSNLIWKVVVGFSSL